MLACSILLILDRRRLMDERRALKRKRVIKAGRIVISDKAPMIECQIKKITADGACLHVSTTYGMQAGLM